MCNFELQSLVGVRAIGSSGLNVLLESAQAGEDTTESHVVSKLENEQVRRCCIEIYRVSWVSCESTV